MINNSISGSGDSKLEVIGAITLIILVTVVAYGLMLKSFGYYSDEWYIAWAGRTSGPDMIIDLHQFDRPLMGYFYSFFYIILGDNPLGWQIFAVLLRLLSALVFWFTLRMLWPDSVLATTSVALLFAVYPGFMGMPKAIIKVNPLFSLACALLSIAFTILSVKVSKTWKKIIFQIFAIISGIIYMFYVEYMIGLEFIRWAFVWIALKKKDNSITKKDHATQWLIYTGPFLLAAIIMMVWRMFYFESGRQAMNVKSIVSNFTSTPLHSIGSLFIEPARDFIESTLYVWAIQGYSMTAGALYRPWLISLLLASIVIISYLGYSKVSNKFQSEDSGLMDVSKQFSWIGGFGVIAALLPLIIVGRQVYLDSAKFNKYTLHVSVAASLMIVGFLLILAQRRRLGFVITISILLGLSIQTHYFNGLRYADDWQMQKNLWWQLTWRAPDLLDDTLLAVRIPTRISISENYEIWGPANIIYRPESSKVNITGEIISSATEGWYLRGIKNNKNFRGVIPLRRRFKNTLILTIPNPSSCMHVIDGNRLVDNSEHPQVKVIYETSHIDRIIMEKDRSIIPPEEIFGVEPEHEWCFYYQKISLAVQRGDWETATDLADQASDLGFNPINQSEWIPVFEAYVNTNRMDDANRIAEKITKNVDLRYLYCKQSWNQTNELAYALICEND